MQTAPKKIFITIPWFTPAYKAGGPIRSVNNMIDLIHEDVQYFILTSNVDLDGSKHKKIKTDTWYKFNEYTNVMYSDSTLRSNRIINEVKNIQPDVIMVVGIYSWHFTLVPILFCKAETKIISVRGMLHTAALQKKALKKNIYLAGLKAIGLENRAIFHATDSVEGGYVQEVFGKKARIAVAQNIPSLFESITENRKVENELVLISVCLLGPMKNILLVLQALAICNEKVVYHIHGIISDTEYWSKCLDLIHSLPANVSVTYHGELRAGGIAVALQNADIYIQPSASENYGHSIAEALGLGLPVITSKYTPWNDLFLHKAGKNVSLESEAIRDEISFFAKMNHEEFGHWKSCARIYFEKNTDVPATIAAYKKMFEWQ